MYRISNIQLLQRNSRMNSTNNLESANKMRWYDKLIQDVKSRLSSSIIEAAKEADRKNMVIGFKLHLHDNTISDIWCELETLNL